jgi:hypothetical protein
MFFSLSLVVLSVLAIVSFSNAYVLTAFGKNLIARTPGPLFFFVFQ